MSRVQCAVGSRDACVPSPCLAQEEEYPQMGNIACQTGSKAIYGLLTWSGRVHKVSSGALRGAGDNMHQPPDPLDKIPRVGHISDYGVR